MNFIIFNRKTGQINRVGACSPNNYSLQIANDTEEIMEGFADDETHKVNPKTLRIEKKRLSAKDKAAEILKNQLDKQEQMILDKMQEMFRTMAVKKLKSEGKL